jgi:hypothetical protein
MIPNCNCNFCSKPIYRKTREEQFRSDKHCNECDGIASIPYSPSAKTSTLRRGMDEVNAIRGIIPPKGLAMQPWRK